MNWIMVWQRNMLLNHSVFVKRKHNLLSPNGDNDLNITLYPYSAIKPFVRGKTHTVSAGFSAFPIFWRGIFPHRTCVFPLYCYNHIAIRLTRYTAINISPSIPISMSHLMRSAISWYIVIWLFRYIAAFCHPGLAADKIRIPPIRTFSLKQSKLMQW